MSYFVFVDIDGVLVTTRANFDSIENDYETQAKFDPVCIDFFNYLDRTYDGVKFVLTSTWKGPLNNYLDGPDEGFHFHWVVSCFRNAGFRGNFAPNWKTGYKDSISFPKWNRNKEIAAYMEENPCKDYLILDDEDFGYKLMAKKRFIHTHEHDGLSWKNIQNAKSIVGMWDRKDEK